MFSFLAITRCSIEVVSTAAIATNSNQINYELVGIVVHSGQANAGHYYSFIKDRRCVCHTVYLNKTNLETK